MNAVAPPASRKAWSSHRFGTTGSSIRRTGPWPRTVARGRHTDDPCAVSTGVPPTVSIVNFPGRPVGRATSTSVPTLPSPDPSTGTSSAKDSSATF